MGFRLLVQKPLCHSIETQACNSMPRNLRRLPLSVPLNVPRKVSRVRGQKATQKESSKHGFLLLRFFTWARSKQILTTVLSKTDNQNVCSCSLDRTRINHNWLPATVTPPPLLLNPCTGAKLSVMDYACGPTEGGRRLPNIAP